MKLKTFCLSIAMLGCFAATASADTIPVTNASFETANPLNVSCGAGCAYNNGPIPGWTLFGFGGSWQPSSAYFTSGAPDGNLVAYLNGGFITQTLGVSLLANTTYTLSVDVGNRLDHLTTNYGMALFAGSTLLNSLTASNGLIPAGTFANESFSFTSGATVPSGNLMIVLGTAGIQSDFDNVRLTASPVPEPASLALLGIGLGLVAFVIRRR